MTIIIPLFFFLKKHRSHDKSPFQEYLEKLWRTVAWIPLYSIIYQQFETNKIDRRSVNLILFTQLVIVNVRKEEVAAINLA